MSAPFEGIVKKVRRTRMIRVGTRTIKIHIRIVKQMSGFVERVEQSVRQTILYAEGERC